MTLGPTIRRLREERHLQVNELAIKVGLDPSYLGKIERGKVKNLSSELLADIAVALDVSIDYLYIEAGKLGAEYDPGELALSERRLIHAIRTVPTPKNRQRVLEMLTWVAEAARAADLADRHGLRLVAEDSEDYGEET